MNGRIAAVLDQVPLDPETRARLDAALAASSPMSPAETQALEAIGQHPECELAQLAKLLGRSSSRTRHVITRLRARALIEPAEGATLSAGPWRLTAASSPAPVCPPGNIGRPDKVRRRVWDALASGRTFTRGEFAAETGLAPQSISAALSWFEAHGQAERVDGVWQQTPRARRYTTPEPVRDGAVGEVATMTCERRKSAVTVAACHDCWSEAHLHDRRKDPGWQCPQGARVRLETVWNLSVTPRRVDAVMRHALSDDIRCPRWAYIELGLSPMAERKE